MESVPVATSATTAIVAAKAALRTHVLAAARAACKVNAPWRAEQSASLCQRLWELPLVGGAAGDVQQQPRYVNIGLYLPLWFEADVEPLVRRLLRQRSSSSGSGSGGTNSNDTRQQPIPRVFVPELVTPCDMLAMPLVADGGVDAACAPASASSSPGDNATRSSIASANTALTSKKTRMRFVEVIDEADLDANFAPVPPFNIREPPAAARDPAAAYRLRLIDASAMDTLVAPGVAFDRHCNRLGKGGGYYDRWLGDSGRCRVVGVGFDEQLPPTAIASHHLESPVDGAVACGTTSNLSWWPQVGADADATITHHASKEEALVPTAPWDRRMLSVVTPSRTFFRDERSMK